MIMDAHLLTSYQPTELPGVTQPQGLSQLFRGHLRTTDRGGAAQEVRQEQLLIFTKMTEV